MTLSMPTLYSYGAVSVLPGQSVSLNDVTARQIMSQSWSISFQVRLSAQGAGGQLFSFGKKGDVVINAGNKPTERAAVNNDVRAIFNTYGNKKVTVDSSYDLEIGVWYNITMTVEVIGKNHGDDEHANVTIYTAGSPFGSSDSGTNQPSPTRVDGYKPSSDKSQPILGGGVHAEFGNIILWDTLLTETEIIQNNYLAPMTTPVYEANFMPLVAETGKYTFNEGVQMLCIDPALSIAGGVALPDPADNLNPGGDLSKPFALQMWVYSTPPTNPDNPIQALISNGLATSQLSFMFGLQYTPDLESFSLRIKVLGVQKLVEDTAALAPHRWYNLIVNWDGSLYFTFYVNGVLTSSQPVARIASTIDRPNVSIGAAASPEESIGFSKFFTGYLQSVGMWGRMLSEAEIENYQTPLPDSDEGAVAFYDLTSTEFANNITGRRLAFKGTTAFSETTTTQFVPSPNRGISPDPRIDFVNLSNIEYVEDNPPFSPDTAELGVLQEQIDFFLKSVPTKLQPALRQQMEENFRIGLQRANNAQGAVPGCLTSTIEGEERVFYYHTANGPVETLRVPARTLTDCQAWVIEMGVGIIGLFLSVIGVGFAGKGLTKIVAKEAVIIGRTLEEVGDLIGTPAGIVRFISFLLAKGKLATIVSKAISSKVSWYKLAFTLASIMANIIGMFATGGAYLAFIVGQVALNIIVVTITITQKPNNCP